MDATGPPAGGGWPGSPPYPPQWPDAPPPKQKVWPVLLTLGAGVVFVAVIVGVLVVAFGSSDDTPKAWDPQVAPIASQVESRRGLTFKHPVKVNYLSEKDFEERVTASPEELKDRREEIERAAAVLRAAGLIGGRADLAQEFNAASGADTIAFYDNNTRQVYVRATGPITVETRVTLAHELTHVLQDQHFNLKKLKKAAADSRSGSSDALTALIEGDAVRIEKAYLKDQSAADRRRYDKLSGASSDTARKKTEKNVSALVDTLFGAPYIFGPEVVGMLETSGGNRAVDAALHGPPPSTRIYFDPTAVSDTPTAPSVPELNPGEERLSDLSSNEAGFDSFQLYLMVAAKLDEATALRAVDAFSTGSQVLYKRAGVVCFRAAVEAIDDGGRDYLESVLRRWVKTMPSAEVETVGRDIVFHACDPGREVPAPADERIVGATTLAATRDAIASELASQEIPGHVAVCIGRLIMQEADWRRAITKNPDAEPTAQMLSESRTAALKCRNDPNTGLP